MQVRVRPSCESDCNIEFRLTMFGHKLKMAEHRIVAALAPCDDDGGRQGLQFDTDLLLQDGRCFIEYFSYAVKIARVIVGDEYFERANRQYLCREFRRSLDLPDDARGATPRNKKRRRKSKNATDESKQGHGASLCANEVPLLLRLCTSPARSSGRPCVRQRKTPRVSGWGSSRCLRVGRVLSGRLSREATRYDLRSRCASCRCRSRHGRNR